MYVKHVKMSNISLFCFVSNSQLGSSIDKNHDYFFKVDVTSFKLSMNKGLCINRKKSFDMFPVEEYRVHVHIKQQTKNYINNMNKNNAIHMRAMLLSINQSINSINCMQVKIIIILVTVAYHVIALSRL
jgi:hypothetical protein